ncbi:MAG: hypothetical protein J1F69_06310 [Clostridiales bacterium]|nr:hypothetical protein [Clostridiales bacterium]
MKSKFAKFIDGTVGVFLIFFAAVAVFRYFIPASDIVLFCAFSVTAAICLLSKLRTKKRGERFTISKAADDMFFEFMFLPENAPAALLASGLKAKNEPVVRHGGGVFVNDTAAYCVFSQPADEAISARLIAKAKHYGANKLILFCKSPPVVPQVDGVTVTSVYGDDVYTLFASLNALPKRKYADKSNVRQNAFKNAFSPDKIVRYAVLAVSFYFVSQFSRSIITFACSVFCAALSLIAITLSIVRAAKKRKTN